MMLRLATFALLAASTTALCHLCINGGEPLNADAILDASVFDSADLTDLNITNVTCQFVYEFLASFASDSSECTYVQSDDVQSLCGCDTNGFVPCNLCADGSSVGLPDKSLDTVLTRLANLDLTNATCEILEFVLYTVPSDDEFCTNKDSLNYQYFCGCPGSVNQCSICPEGVTVDVNIELPIDDSTFITCGELDEESSVFTAETCAELFSESDDFNLCCGASPMAVSSPVTLSPAKSSAPLDAPGSLTEAPVGAPVQNTPAPLGTPVETTLAPSVVLVQTTLAPSGALVETTSTPSGALVQNTSAPAGALVQNTSAPTPRSSIPLGTKSAGSAMGATYWVIIAVTIFALHY